ncbi:hypothetical protein GOV07_02800 [Candidatus Woesearchaeota archaeon]|nr:hypothetical protein [Candidatus Woesearchaeota archaeon]
MDRRLIIFTLIILLLPTVTAFKVGPAAQTFVLEPGTTSQYDLRIFNDGGTALKVSVTATGPFADQVTLEPSSFVMTVEERERRVLVTLTHPAADALSPGKNTVGLRVSAKPDSEGQFSGAVSLNHNLNLYRRYDGTYIEGSLTVKDATAKGSEVVFTLSLANRGTEDGIVTGTTVLLVTGNPVATIPLGTTLLAPDAEGKLAKRWVADVEPGRYDAQTTYAYDDRGTRREELLDGSVAVGTPNVILKSPVEKLQADSIVGLDLTATLLWNEPVEAEATVTLLRDDELIVQATTPATTLNPDAAAGLSAFLEVPDIEPGDYLIKIAARTTGGIQLGEETFPITVTAQPGILPTIETPSSFITPILVLLFFVVLITFMLRWFKTRTIKE